MKWKLELAIIVIAIFAVVLFIAPKQGMLSITGFVSTEIQRQQVNLEISQSGGFVLKNADSTPLSIIHFSITGSVVGEGAAQVFLKSNGKRVLVYSNIYKKKQGLIGITGQFVNSAAQTREAAQAEYLEILESAAPSAAILVPDGYETAEELFKDSCAESCALPAEFYNSESYTLEVLVSPGTTLKIDEIDFILAK